MEISFAFVDFWNYLRNSVRFISVSCTFWAEFQQCHVYTCFVACDDLDYRCFKEKKKKRKNKYIWYFILFIIVVALCVVAMVLGLDYEKHEILIGYFFYIFYDKSFMVIIFGYISIFKEFFSLLGFGFTLFYNGKRGRQNKILNYLFYPVHLLILGILRIFLKI